MIYEENVTMWYDENMSAKPYVKIIQEPCTEKELYDYPMYESTHENSIHV